MFKVGDYVKRKPVFGEHWIGRIIKVDTYHVIVEVVHPAHQREGERLTWLSCNIEKATSLRLFLAGVEDEGSLDEI